MAKTEKQIELEWKLLGLKYAYRSDILPAMSASRQAEKPVDFADMATRHGLSHETRRRFVDEVLGRCICEGGRLSELTLPPELDWTVRIRSWPSWKI